MGDIDTILASVGLAPVPVPAVPVPLNGPAEGYRIEALDKLERAKAAIDILAAMVRHYPMSRDRICAVTHAIATPLNEAGLALDNLNAVLDCQGAA